MLPCRPASQTSLGVRPWAPGRPVSGPRVGVAAGLSQGVHASPQHSDCRGARSPVCWVAMGPRLQGGGFAVWAVDTGSENHVWEIILDAMAVWTEE